MAISKLFRLQLPKVKTGCLCCSLHVSCTVQGYIALVIISAILVAGWVYVLCNIRYTLTYNCEEVYVKEATNSYTKTRNDYYCLRETIWRDTLALIMFVLTVDLAAVIAFLRGIYKRDANLILLYVRVLIMHLFMGVFVLVWGLCEAAQRGLYIGLDIVVAVVIFYMLVCANSLHQKLISAPLPPTAPGALGTASVTSPGTCSATSPGTCSATSPGTCSAASPSTSSTPPSYDEVRFTKCPPVPSV